MSPYALGVLAGSLLMRAITLTEPLVDGFLAGLADGALGAPDDLDSYTPTPQPEPPA